MPSAIHKFLIATSRTLLGAPVPRCDAGYSNTPRPGFWMAFSLGTGALTLRKGNCRRQPDRKRLRPLSESVAPTLERLPGSLRKSIERTKCRNALSELVQA